MYWKYRTAGHLVFWKPWPVTGHIATAYLDTGSQEIQWLVLFYQNVNHFSRTQLEKREKMGDWDFLLQRALDHIPMYFALYK